MYIGMILALITGLFFLIGIIIFNNKNKEGLKILTTSLAFIVISDLLFLELLPELIEIKNIYLIIPVVIGFLLLTVLDKLIPHHYHEHSKCDKIDHNLHLNHIGVITIVALVIHNIIEGISLYNVCLNNIKSGILMTLAISLHNIPLGLQIGNSINKKNNILLIVLLCISTFLGSLIMFLFKEVNEYFINILLSIAFGMLLYILIFEILNEMRKYLSNKETLYGIIIGIIVLFITHIL